MNENTADQDNIMKRMEADLGRIMDAKPMPPTKGFWVVDSGGKITPASSKTPDLDWIADVQTAPQGKRNIPVLCAASVMFDALKETRRDPGRKHLSAKTLEMIDEALSAAE